MRSEPLSIAQLEHLLAFLEPLDPVVDSWRYSWELVDVGWDRPHGELVLRGGGHEGRGEYIAFTPEEHERFGPDASDAYTLAVWESARVDLALQQRGISLAGVCGVSPHRFLQICWSFGSVPHPVPPGKLKIEHQEGATYDGLDVVVVDLKERPGVPEVPAHVILEDPMDPVRSPWAIDQTLFSVADLGSSTHANLKIGRMGGPIEVVRTALKARELGIELYWGGQWELGVGRLQAQRLAALLCPNGWNDLAPIAGAPDDVYRLRTRS